MVQELTVQVMKGIEAVITPVSQDISLDDPIVAINWFNTRSLALYNIYNLLASRSVFKVGGQVVIKGKVLDVLAGDPKDHRDVVLIVRYPSGPRFLSMIQSTYFKVVSLLRTAAVARFTFGFTQPVAHSPPASDSAKDKAYLIHHYRGNDVGDALVQVASEHDVGVVYAGQTVAHLATRKPNAADLTLPSLLDGIAIFQAESTALLKDFTTSDGFQSVTQSNETSYTATFQRLL
jgi:hypothetical protein